MQALLHTLMLALPLALVPALSGAAPTANINTTLQTGKVNINHTVQCGDSNDNVTYQTGRVNINRTVQRCGGNGRYGVQARPGRGKSAKPTRGHNAARGHQRSRPS